MKSSSLGLKALAVGVILTLNFGPGANAAPASQPAASAKSAAKPAVVQEKVVPATSWEVDAAHSRISFSIRHIFTPTVGKFDKHQIDLKFDPKNLAGSSVVVTIPVSSLNTDNEKRDGHLLTADFFNEESFEAITFKSKKFRAVKGKENQFEIVGDFTMKDVTKEIVLPFKLLGMMNHPMKKEMVVAGAEASLTIKRNDYGVGTGGYAETAIIGDEVTITIQLEASRKL